MRRRAYTLVELMITVAVLGILAALAGGAGRASRLTALGELKRARALVLLEYRAGCEVSGNAPDPEVVARLTEALPGAEVTVEAHGPTVTVRARWEGARDRVEERSLTVFQKGRDR
jgi:prepilin-type N-terminal cleavage/methylation domain-containing protein